MVKFEVKRAVVTSVEEIEDFDDEYVYDIGINQDTPWFFANNMLVHNSGYFSAYQVLKNHPDYEDFDWSRENIISLYDDIADMANETFPEFMQKTFNTDLRRGSLIKAGRELIGSKALFIKKKKYAVLMYDKENNRLDVNGKPGKLKVMGLDIKRADTPKFMQKFLETLLMDVLTDKNQKTMYEDIKVFRELFKERPAWEKGTPRKVSNLSGTVDALEHANNVGLMGDTKGKKLKINMPGHVRASINWNNLCDLHKDKYSIRITDGTRLIVCKLIQNPMNIDSIAYPIDQPHLPEWFKRLPFDNPAMEETIIDNKLKNLVGVLNWNLTETKEHSAEDFFSFEEPKAEVSRDLGHNSGPDWEDDD